MESFNLFAGVFRQSFLPPHYNWKVASRFVGVFHENFTKKLPRIFFSTIAYKKEVRYYSNFLLLFGYYYLTFYAMSLLLNVAIPIKNKNAVIEIPNMAVVKTLLTVKDVKDFSNRKLSGKSPFTKFAILPLVDYCFLKTSFIIFVNFGGVP